MENVTLKRRKKVKERTMFIVLCVIIALVILANVFALTLAYFTDRSSGSVSFRMGNVDIVGYVYDGNGYTNTALSLGSDVVFPGSTTTQKIKLKNNGNANFYLRLNCSFQLYINSTWADANGLLEIDHIIMPDGETVEFGETTSGNIFYYLGIFESNKTITGIDITFKVSESLGNSDLQNLINYQNIQYKIFLDVDVVQAANVSLDTTSADAMNSGWPI